MLLSEWVICDTCSFWAKVARVIWRLVERRLEFMVILRQNEASGSMSLLSNAPVDFCDLDVMKVLTV